MKERFQMTVRMTIIIADLSESPIVWKVYSSDKGRFMVWNKRENKKRREEGNKSINFFLLCLPIVIEYAAHHFDTNENKCMHQHIFLLPL